VSLETNGMTKADLARLAAMRQTENDTLRAQLSDMTKERDEVRAQAGVTTEVLKHALDWAKRDFRERVSQALFELSGSAASRDASIRAEGRREATAEALAEFDRVFSPISELLLGLKVRDPVRSALLGIRTKLHKTTSPLASTPPSKPSEEKPQPSAPLGKETK
jgi:hypothetical protein